ncbi:MAG: thymidine phosphorylase [Betaproteobacteria bacterium]|nr:thymidine phosphorylase [Betaproteobacteria bacterium]
MFLPQEIIRKKRDKQTLTREEIHFFVQSFATGVIPDYQMAALAMAVVLNGMNDEETASLLTAMINSGERMDWTPLRKQGIPCVDKHSTGGVGDKTSLIILPLLVADGLAVPMVAGRGLGHTGGTVDKLEAIPGFMAQPNSEQFRSWIIARRGAFGAQTDSFVPADKKLYALRDVTATVESISLITASIMSKKLAEDLDALILDVKFGSGAFLQSYGSARELAQSLVNAGKMAGCRVEAALTNMDEPLGRTAGHACEVVECLDILQGAGAQDTRELSLQLAARAAVLGHQDTSIGAHEKAYTRMKKHLESGRAYDVFLKIAEQQGAHLSALERSNKEWIESGTIDVPVLADIQDTQRVESINTRALGLLLIEMGAGRKKKEDAIDHKVGLVNMKKVGETVTKGEPLCLLRLRKHDTHADKLQLDAAAAFLLTDPKKQVSAKPLVADWIK